MKVTVRSVPSVTCPVVPSKDLGVGVQRAGAPGGAEAARLGGQERVAERGQVGGVPAHGLAERGQLLAVERDAVGRVVRDAVAGRVRTGAGARRARGCRRRAPSAKSWPRVTGLSAGLSERPGEQRVHEGGRGVPPRRRGHDDARGAALRKAFSKWTKESPASSCSAPRTGLAGLAVKRALKVESAAAAGMVEPCPRSSVKGWAKV